MPNKTIAIVDDDEDIVELVAHNLNKVGYKTKGFHNGMAFLNYLRTDLPDLVILDIMLPGSDGFEICKILKNSSRTSSLPIIMLSAKGTEADIVAGLELGADDYVVKPMSPRVLEARVKTILRRANAKADDPGVVTIGALTVDSERYVATVDGVDIPLTTTEFKILEVLAAYIGKVFTRDELLKKKRLWGDDKLVYDRTIDVHIKNLREKMGDAGNMIKTIRGIGYKLEP